eukprot:m.416950 g.416950  ORF g.416950 m.416950 type:complete len:112 (+) comp30185_c0_seq1:77-412(+)
MIYSLQVPYQARHNQTPTSTTTLLHPHHTFHVHQLGLPQPVPNRDRPGLRRTSCAVRECTIDRRSHKAPSQGYIDPPSIQRQWHLLEGQHNSSDGEPTRETAAASSTDDRA